MYAWNAGLEIGHPDMDLEHRGLYDLTARAGEALAKEDPGGVADSLGTLFRLAEAHFEHEERLMAQSAYDGLETHVEAHRAFKADFLALRAELEARGLSALFRLWFGSRFQDWLRFHIRGQDAQLYRHLRQWMEEQARQAEAKQVAAAAAPPPDRKGS